MELAGTGPYATCNLGMAAGYSQHQIDMRVSKHAVIERILIPCMMHDLTRLLDDTLFTRHVARPFGGSPTLSMPEVEAFKQRAVHTS